MIEQRCPTTYLMEGGKLVSGSYFDHLLSVVLTASFAFITHAIKELAQYSSPLRAAFVMPKLTSDAEPN